MSTKSEFYIPSLDGFRAIAVAIVLLSHVGLKGAMPGGFGVTIFFFLSGYLITTLMVLERERTGGVSLRLFYLRRVLRILPPMYLVLALALGIALVLGTPISGSVVSLQALHLTNYHIAFGGTGELPGTEVLWSLAVEEHFYLLFPFAFIALSAAVSPTRRPHVLLAACVIVLVWRVILVSVLHQNADYTQHATDTRIDSILFGCALAVWRNPALPGFRMPARTIWIGFVVGLLVLAATLVARDEWFRETLRYSLQGLALTPVFIAAIAFPTAWPFVLLNSSVMRWGGLLSYSLYLVHLPIIRLLEPRLHGATLLVVAFALSVVAAAVIYFAVEKPCARLRRKLSRVATPVQP